MFVISVTGGQQDLTSSRTITYICRITVPLTHIDQSPDPLL